MIRPGAYAAHEAYIAPAVPSKALWRLVVGMVLVVVSYIALNRLFFQTIHSLTQDTDPGFVDRVFDGLAPAPLLLLLTTFAFMTLSAAWVVRVLHKRAALSLLGPMPLALRQFVSVFAALAVFGIVVFVLPPWGMGAPLVPNLAPGLWVTLLPLSILMVFVQVSAEEVVFRGYVQQQLAARFRSPLVWMITPSVLFALGHYLPDEAGENAWLIAIWSGFFGILMADITARAGTLGPAIALHFFNNVAALLVVAVPDSLSGLALFHTPFGMGDTEKVRAWLPVDFAHMTVAWLVARAALRR